MRLEYTTPEAVGKQTDQEGIGVTGAVHAGSCRTRLQLSETIVSTMLVSATLVSTILALLVTGRYVMKVLGVLRLAVALFMVGVLNGDLGRLGLLLFSVPF